MYKLRFAGFDYSVNCLFVALLQRTFFHHYLTACGVTPSEEEIQKLYLETQLFQLGPHFLWAFWSLASGISSEMNFDYMVCILFHEYRSYPRGGKCYCEEPLTFSHP